MGKATELTYKKIIDILIAELEELQGKLEELQKIADERLKKSIDNFDKQLKDKRKSPYKEPRWYNYN
jgi:riboflavin synthase